MRFLQRKFKTILATWTIYAIDHEKVIDVQDQDDERHLILRPIERTEFDEFIQSIERSFGKVNLNNESNQLWELDVRNLSAKKIQEYCTVVLENVINLNVTGL
jgi:hypothetical protein